jgi:methyl-branched lipid omega-hydroxylase
LRSVEPRAVLTVDEIDLSDTAFWARPWDEREGAFQTLRRERPMPFYDEPEIPEALSYVIPKGNGYYALTRHAHIAEASRHPEICPAAPHRVRCLQPAHDQVD